MIKGYITGCDRVTMWTNHFVHNKDTHTHTYTRENMISGSDRSRLCLIQTDRQIDRHKYEGQGPVKYNNVRAREYFFSLSPKLYLKTMSCVLWQMVNVHGCWTHIRERKRIGDDDDASLWPRRRRQQIELAIMCLSSCLARESKGASERANERKSSVGQVVSRRMLEQDYIFLSRRPTIA
jgi:hypothetical protein